MHIITIFVITYLCFYLVILVAFIASPGQQCPRGTHCYKDLGLNRTEPLRVYCDKEEKEQFHKFISEYLNLAPPTLDKSKTTCATITGRWVTGQAFSIKGCYWYVLDKLPPDVLRYPVQQSFHCRVSYCNQPWDATHRLMFNRPFARIDKHWDFYLKVGQGDIYA